MTGWQGDDLNGVASNAVLVHVSSLRFIYFLKIFFISVFRFLLSPRTSQHWLAYQ